MPKVARKKLDEKIKECRRLASSKNIISCLEALFLSTNDGLVAYEIGHEFEKIGKPQDAVEYYERAETLFKSAIYKNMARAAINNLSIEVLLAAERKKKR